MATLTVVEFEHSDAAKQALGTLTELQKQKLINIQDAAIVSWPVGAKKPKTEQLHNLAGAGARTAPSGVCCSDSFFSFRCLVRRSARRSAHFKAR